MKKIIQAGLLIMCFLLVGCGVKEDKSEIVIKVNDKNINYTLTTRPFTTKDDFKKAYLKIDREELIYVPKGSKVTVDLNDQSGKVSIKAYWINKEGAPNYNDSFGVPLCIDVNVEEIGDSKCEFIVERLLQAGLSSYYEENEKITAGYVAELHSDDETQYCFFMIQTDKS